MSITKSNTRMLEGEDLTLTGELLVDTIKPNTTNIAFSTGGSERMRILSNGAIGMGTASQITNLGFNPLLNISATMTPAYFKNTGGGSCLALQSGGTLGTQFFAYLMNGNGVAIGGISTSGGQTGVSVSYNTSSDYRLKENVVDITDGITRVKQLEPKKFNFIADAGTTVDGFLAHEAQAVVPEAVHGTKDEVDDEGNPVMQGIDQSKLVPLLVKTIQELEARITALEAE